MRRLSGAAFTAIALLSASSALAQSKPTPAPAASAAADPAFETQKAAFLAADEATRKGIQDGLSWLGLYNGAVDGGFGKRTRDAILAYQTSIHATVDGVLGPSLVTALKAAADKARAAVGFVMVDDPKMGLSYGAPLKLLDKRTSAAGAIVLMRADGSIKLTIDEKKDADADLAALYARLSAETPARKVAYKAIKSGAFFVVAGMDSGKKFYSRYDLGPDTMQPTLRGFTFSYPETRADLDRVTLAIAAAFAPFKAAAASPAAEATPAVSPVPSPRPTVAVKPTPGPSGPGFAGIALVVGAGKAITTLAPTACPHPTIAGKLANFVGGADAGALTTLTGDFAPRGAPQPLAGKSADEGVVVAFAENSAPRLEASAAKLLNVGGEDVVVAPLAKGSAGAPIFARDGALIGLVLPSSGEPLRVGGRLVSAPHAFIGAATIAKTLGDDAKGADAASPLSVGDLLRQKADAVLGVTCTP